MLINIEAKEERLQDLLTSALEGGSNDWYFINEFNYPNKCPKCGELTPCTTCPKCIKITIPQTKESLGIEFVHIELPFKGGWLTFTVPEDEDGKEYILDMKAIQRGVKVMAERYPGHFSDWVSENDDAITGDVFLQCCLFGEVVYE